ncbi:MAG: hypothetical protein WD557_05795 [Dehalococcoidia bacterium]
MAPDRPRLTVIPPRPEIFPPRPEIGANRPRGYIENYRPQSRTLQLIEQVREILRIYGDHLPLTVRQIFYILIGRFAHGKSDSFYKSLCEHLSNARRGGAIDFRHIRDDGVSVLQETSFAGLDQFYRYLQRQAGSYARNRLARQSHHIEVWCEAAGMQPQLNRVAGRYHIPVYSTGGFDSTTAKWNLAQRICRVGKPAIILHLGDFDPSGVSIFETAAEDVRAFVLADRKWLNVDVEFVRVALTDDLIERHRLETDPHRVKSDKDYRGLNWPFNYTCQLEALPPDVLATVLNEEIRRHLDLDLLAADIRLEGVERAEAESALRALPAPGQSVVRDE